MRWAVVVLVGLAAIAGIWSAIASGSPEDDATPTTVFAIPTTAGVTAAAAETTTTAAASRESTGGDTESPVETTTTTTVVVTTTTEAPADPIDERLPRTEAEATETDPVPVGEVFEAAPGLWDIALTDVDLDAADTVLGFAEINPEPADGFQYVLVKIEGTYLGESVAQPVFEWAVLAGDEEYLPSIPGCGVIPDSIYDVIEIAPGASFEAHMCMPVSAEDIAAGIELYLGAPGDDPRYFSLD
jgi:hypothetical protein